MESSTEASGGRPTELSVDDLRALLRLNTAMHRAGPDPALRKRVLLEGLCRLAAADSALSVVTRLDAESSRRVVVSVAYATPGFGGWRTRGGAVANPASSRRAAGSTEPREAGAWHGPAEGEALRRHAGMDRYVDSVLILDGLRLVASVSVGRRPGDPRPFRARQRALVEALHAESGWVYRHDRWLASAAILALPARRRRVLEAAVAGEVDARIAARLGLAVEVVRDQVSAAYRDLGLAGREALLLEWDASEPPGGSGGS